MNSCVTPSDIAQITESVLPWVCFLIVALVLLAIWVDRIIESLVFFLFGGSGSAAKNTTCPECGEESSVCQHCPACGVHRSQCLCSQCSTCISYQTCSDVGSPAFEYTRCPNRVEVSK